MHAHRSWMVALLLLAACGPRQVEVRTTPSPTAANDLAIHLTNNLTQPVNVYVVTQGTDLFVKQVGGNQTEHLAVRGVSAGSTVKLKATTVDGTKTYTSGDVVLSGTYPWKVP
jgi:hypothetical protein